VFSASLNTLITAAGFTLVETWTSATKSAPIYKSPAASNSFGSDWYFSISRTADTDTFPAFIAGEAYNSTTHKFTSYCPTSATYTPTGTYAVNDATGQLPDSATLKRVGLTIATAGFSYWASINCNRIIIGTRIGSSDQAIYCGLYDDLLPIAMSPFPLCVVNLGGSGNQGAGSREPGATASTASAFGINTGGSSLQWTPMSTTLDTYNGKYVPSRAVIWSQRTGSQSSASGIRGLLKSAVYCAIPSSVNGDTLATLDSAGATVNYVRCGAAGGGDYWLDISV
jgi:hypothetical protein